MLQFMIRIVGNSDNAEVMKGVDVVETLKTKLDVGQDVLKLKFVELDTVVCQNDCSGHGSCHQSTRDCICDPFWVENFVRRRLMDGKKNCEWSVIYLGIFLSFGVLGHRVWRGLRVVQEEPSKIGQTQLRSQQGETPDALHEITTD